MPPEIDPATGLASSTVVRPLRDGPSLRPSSTLAAPGKAPAAAAGRPHIALILPTTSPALGRLAEAVRLGFNVAADAAGREGAPVIMTAVDNEGAGLLEACRNSQAAGAFLVVAGLTRDGAQDLARSDCVRQPVLALNEPIGTRPGTEGQLPENLFHVSLSLESEARQSALLAVADGFRSAVVIANPTPLARRVQEAFEREWSRAAGEIRRVQFSGNVEEAPAIRERLANARADMVFFALDADSARAVRPYVSGTLPIYATSHSVNPRADSTVNVDLQGVRYMEMPWFVQPDHPGVMAYPPARGGLSVDEERLYAYGIDAYRIAHLILKSEAGHMALDGVTGRIGMESGRSFARALVPSEVDGGRVVPRNAQ